MPTVMNVVGARPQFVKAGPVSRALATAGCEEILVNTGQHYDNLLTDAIMVDVGLREPDIDLEVGSDSHGIQTARMLERLEAVMLDTRPDAVLTYGDTNSTVAGALAATKLHIPTAHVEAGLRSFNRAMPEELNRVATDHLSDLLLAPTSNAMSHLEREGLSERSVLSGDVMVDALQSIDLTSIASPAWAKGRFYVATVHRPSNTDDPARLSMLLDALGKLDAPVHLLTHPRLRSRLEVLDRKPGESLIVHEPLPYAVMLKTASMSAGLITDSGGLQKEAYILGVKCTTLRDETEWPETLNGNWNVLVGDSLDRLAIHVTRSVVDTADWPFGKGDAANRIVAETVKLTN